MAFRLIFAIFLFIVSNPVYSLTVGGVVAKSGYGEKLLLEIELYNLYDYDYSDIAVRVVPKAEHGIESTTESSLGNLSIGFFVSKGIGWVTLTTSKVIYNGDVDIVVEVSWPGGRAFRRYKTSPIGMPSKDPESQVICPSSGRWIRCVKSNDG